MSSRFERKKRNQKSMKVKQKTMKTVTYNTQIHENKTTEESNIVSN